MSYDVSFTIDTGSGNRATVDSFNHTYNCSPMFYRALGKDVGIPGLHGMTGAAAVPFLSEAVQRMLGDPDGYKALNPSNGWGDYESALRFLECLLAAAKAHPATVIDVG